jgi:hypothetical protein
MIPSFGSRDRFPQKKDMTERGGIYAWCPRERRSLYRDEVHQMVMPPMRELCGFCGALIDKHVTIGNFNTNSYNSGTEKWETKIDDNKVLSVDSSGNLKIKGEVSVLQDL